MNDARHPPLSNEASDMQAYEDERRHVGTHVQRHLERIKAQFDAKDADSLNQYDNVR